MRNVIECAFGRLKAHFSALRRDMDINLDDLPFVICACFVLHTYCEVHSETVCNEQIRVTMDYEQRAQPRSTAAAFHNNESEGKRARQVLTKYFDP